MSLSSHQLAPIEARILGSLIEKEITTPDQYPLSLNALVNACNQKSNRDPVQELAEREVQGALDELTKRRLVSAESGYGSRVAKYRHRFCNSEFGSLKFTAQELAVVCELLLRGAQMPGELRARASRMAGFADVAELERVLDQLASRSDGPFVAKLAREPGRRESRYMHLFSGDAPPAASVATIDSPRDASLTERVQALEAEVASFRDEMAALRQSLGG